MHLRLELLVAAFSLVSINHLAAVSPREGIGVRAVVRGAGEPSASGWSPSIRQIGKADQRQNAIQPRRSKPWPGDSTWLDSCRGRLPSMMHAAVSENRRKK